MPSARYALSSLSALSVGLTLALLVAVPFAASAMEVWDESIDGDLSSDPNAPTPLFLSLGSNLVHGSVVAPGDVRDYVTFTIPSGQALAGLDLLLYEDVVSGGPGNTGYHAINAGATSLVPDFANGSSFLGGDHVTAADVGTDRLPDLAAAILAGTGFTIPLGPGTYSYLIQQTGPPLTGYTLDFVLVPEPSTAMLVAVGLAGVGRLRRR